MKRLFLSVVCVLTITAACHSQLVQRVKITSLDSVIRNSRTPLIVNFWATWCKPCLEEMPYLLAAAKKHQQDSVQLILVSLDFKEAFPEKLQGFAQKQQLTGTVYWLDETNADYFCPIVAKSWSGARPASLFINNKTGYRKFYEASFDQASLTNAVKAMLQ